MIKTHTLIASVVIGSITAGLITCQPAFAIAKPANGLSVSPAITNIPIAPQQTTVAFSETVTNISNNLLAVDLTVKDFGALNAYGSIGFYGSSYKPSANLHGLSTFISIPTNEFLIQPHQSQVITVNINNVDQLAPGGHYSAILFTPFIARSSTKSNQVSLQPSVASLVFVTSAAGGTKDIKLGGFSVPDFGLGLPNTAYVLLANTGNTQIVPRGVLSLVDPLSNVVAQTVINSDSGMVLPGTSRLFTINLSTSDNLFKLAGVYHIKLKYRLSSSSTYQTTEKSYFYLNPIVFIYALIIALVILGIKRIYRKPKSKHKKKRHLK